MQTYQVGLIGLALFAILAVLAFASWRKRISGQQATLPKPLEVPGSFAGFKCFYVATTFADNPLERIVAHGLAHRGIAHLRVSESGLEVSRTGEMSFLVPKEDLIQIGKSSAVIDRAVEKEGLVSISWRLGSKNVESHFRVVDPLQRSEMLSKISGLVGVQ